MASKIDTQEECENVTPIIKARLLVCRGYGEIEAAFNPNVVPDEYIEKFLIYVRDSINDWPLWSELTTKPTTH